MKTPLKIILLAVALIVMSGCSAQRRAQRHVRKAVALCPELVQVKAHAVDTVLTVKPWADATTMQLTEVMSGDTLYRATDHGTFIVSHNRKNGEVRIGFLAAPQKLHYRDTLQYAQVVVPKSMANPRHRVWAEWAAWLIGVAMGVAFAVWLLRNALKRN